LSTKKKKTKKQKKKKKKEKKRKKKDKLCSSIVYDSIAKFCKKSNESYLKHVISVGVK